MLELALSMESDNASVFKEARQCKEKTVKNAICAYAKECSLGDVIAIMDTTLFGNGKNGFLLTETILYSSHFFQKELPGKALHLDELEAVSMGERSHICLTMKNGTKKEVFFSIYAKDMEPLLEKIIALKNRQMQVAAASKQKSRPEPKATSEQGYEPASTSEEAKESISFRDLLDSMASEEESWDKMKASSSTASGEEVFEKAKSLFGENIEADILEADRRQREAVHRQRVEEKMEEMIQETIQELQNRR